MAPVLCLLAAVTGAAPPAGAEARLAVDLAASPGSAPWYAAGLAEMISREAARFSRVSVVDPIDTLAACPGRGSECLVSSYAQAGVDVVVLGTLDGPRLHWEVHETWTPARAFSGRLGAQGPHITHTRIQHQVAEIIRPIVASGGLLDKRPIPRPIEAELPSRPLPTVPGEAQARAALATFFGALALLLAWPAALLLLLLGRKALVARAPWRAWGYSALLGAALAGAAACQLLGVELLEPLSARWREVLLPLLGGVLWGALLVLHVSYVFPPLQGLGRIRHDALGPTLRAWVWLATFRGGALVLWAPLLFVTLWAGREAGLEPRLTLWVAVPAVGLYGCFWLASLNEHLARWLDVKLVDGPADRSNAWHATVRKYFMGYLKRGGIVLERRFLERVLFLPGPEGSGFEVHGYGGLLGPPRIVVGAKARELSLGDLPDEPEAPERTTNPEALPLGYVLPHGGDARAQARAERARRRAARAPDRPRAPGMPRLLGEPATALGWVVPHPVDEAVPLISNTREDYEVVKSLLTEHYGRFEKNLDEDEHDDTDPTQKDFLFGPLMVAAGGFTRGDSLGGTLALALALARPYASLPSRVLLRALYALHARFLAWPRAALADAFAALNLALHPLLQHLHLCRGGGPQALTARADAPRLVETSKTLLESLTAQPLSAGEAQLFRPHPRNRMLWLAPFFAARLAPPRGRALKALATAAALLSGAAIAYTQVKQALDYRPLYEERMTQMRAMADQATQGAASP